MAIQNMVGIKMDRVDILAVAGTINSIQTGRKQIKSDFLSTLMWILIIPKQQPKVLSESRLKLFGLWEWLWYHGNDGELE